MAHCRTSTSTSKLSSDSEAHLWQCSAQSATARLRKGAVRTARRVVPTVGLLLVSTPQPLPQPLVIT